MTDTSNVRAMGVAWYTAEAWRQLAAIPEAEIQKGYADFVATFDQIVKAYAAQGIAVEKVDVNVGRMVDWCHRHGYAVNGHGRAVYGTVLLLERDAPGALRAPVIDNTRIAG